MRRQAVHRVVGFLAVGCLAVALGGCMPDALSQVKLGSTTHEAVALVLGPEARVTPGGYSLEEHNPWPTVVRLTHVAAPEGAAAEWKLAFTGRVIHLVLLQTVDVEVLYEGRLSEALLDALRSPKPDDQNEFLAELVRFVDSRVKAGMTAKWTDAESLAADRYRSRFRGLLESVLLELRGRGSMHRDRFAADVSTPSGRLALRYLGGGTYRLELRGLAVLGPLPVL